MTQMSRTLIVSTQYQLSMKKDMPMYGFKSYSVCTGRNRSAGIILSVSVLLVLV